MFHPAVGWSGALALPRWPQAEVGRQGGSLLELWVWLRARGVLESGGGEGEGEAAKPQGPPTAALGAWAQTWLSAGSLWTGPSLGSWGGLYARPASDEADGAPCGRDRA